MNVSKLDQPVSFLFLDDGPGMTDQPANERIVRTTILISVFWMAALAVFGVCVIGAVSAMAAP
jgi:hypothetical protein